MGHMDKGLAEVLINEETWKGSVELIELPE